MSGWPPGSRRPRRDPARGRGPRVPRDAPLRRDRGVPRGRGGLPADSVGRGVHRAHRRRRGGPLMAVSLDLVKKLRDLSGAGMMDCQQAHEEAEGGVERAITILREEAIAEATNLLDWTS